MKPIGQKTVYGGLGGLIIGGFLGGPVGAVVGLLAGGAGGNAFEPTAPGPSGVPVAPGLNAGDIVVYDPLVPGVPDIPASNPALAQAKNVPIVLALSAGDTQRLSAIPTIAGRDRSQLSDSKLLLLRVTGDTSPVAGGIVLSFADPRIPPIPGSIPVPLSGVVMKLNDPPNAPNV